MEYLIVEEFVLVIEYFEIVLKCAPFSVTSLPLRAPPAPGSAPWPPTLRRARAPRRSVVPRLLRLDELGPGWERTAGAETPGPASGPSGPAFRVLCPDPLQASLSGLLIPITDRPLRSAWRPPLHLSRPLVSAHIGPAHAGPGHRLYRSTPRA